MSLFKDDCKRNFMKHTIAASSLATGEIDRIYQYVMAYIENKSLVVMVTVMVKLVK